MARFLYWTDLHTEFERFAPPDIPAPFDAVLLGGDSASGAKHADFLLGVWEKFQKPVFSIRGNHEYYGDVVQAVHRRDAESNARFKDDGVPIRIMDGDCHVIGDTRVIAATLWTDMRWNGPDTTQAKMAVEGALNDHRQINYETDDPALTPILFSADHAVSMHAEQKRKIFGHLAREFDGPTVVMTHHVPHPLCVHPDWRSDPVTAGFASNLDREIADTAVDIWLFGHTHDGVSAEIERRDGGTTRFLTNARGYPGERSRRRFRPDFIFEAARSEVPNAIAGPT